MAALEGGPAGVAGGGHEALGGSREGAAAAQVTGFAPVQTPAWQVSVCVQALPSLQAAPSGFAGSEHEPVAGSQVPASWHWSAAAQTTGVCMQPAGVHASMV